MHTRTFFAARQALLLLLLTLTACSAPAAAPPAAPATRTLTPGTPLIATEPAPSATILPRTAAPGLTPTLTATPVPNPLSIEAMCAGSYPGSDLVLEQQLAVGSNYKRYIASYRSEGLKIYGLLTIPDGQKPASGRPVIIFNHGYIPPDQYHTTGRYVAYVDSLARSGYIVFKSDYRGHDKSEGVARGAYSSPDYVIDVLNALASLKRYPDADPQRIGMWGHSMGGYITLRVMVISKDIRAGVIWGGGVVASYPDLLTKWHRGPGAEAVPTPLAKGPSWRSLVDTYGSPEQNPAFWASISANSYLANISGPLQLDHGTADVEVPLAFSETLYTQMLAAGKYVELYKYAGDNHNISRQFNTAMQRTLEFFDRYLKTP